MRNVWKSMLACLPPSCRMSPDPTRREAILKVVIIAAIGLCAGPELVAALELQILLEMLGATLFMTAFIAGARLAFLSLGESLRGRLLHVAPVALIFVAYIEWWLASAATCIASVQALWTLLAGELSATVRRAQVNTWTTFNSYSLPFSL